MNTTLPCPEPPDDEQNEKDPARRATGSDLPEPLESRGILRMRLPASSVVGSETKFVRTKIGVGTPKRDQFFQVKDGESFSAPFGILDWQRTSSIYLVAPGPVRDWMLEEEVKSYYDCILCLTVTRHGEPGIWPLKCTDNDWHVSAREIAEKAKGEWLKLISNRDSGHYDFGLAADQSKEPSWPAESFEQLLEKAFTGRIIDTLEHEVIQELSGDD